MKWLWTMLLALFLVLVYIRQFWNLFQSTQHGQKHISWHQDQPCTMSGSWVTPWSGSGPCCWHCWWCWVHQAVLKPVTINSAWSKTYIWTLRSTFYDARELSYTISQISGFRGHFQGFRVIFGGLRTSKKLHQTWFHVGLGVLKPFQSENLVYKTIFYLHHITHCVT